MSPNPKRFIEHLRAMGYHPRSDKHSNSLADAIVRDVLASSARCRERAAAGELVYELNFTIRPGTSDWNVDLVMGTPPPATPPPDAEESIRRTSPSTVQIAIEIKSVMTEHRKAVKNRKRDFEAHHEHVHRYSNEAIAAGVLVVNQASTFKSPLRKGQTIHKNVEKLIEHCILQMRSVTTRSNTNEVGLDAKAALVVDMNNVDLASTGYVTRTPAPTVGDPLHYDSFVQLVGSLYTRRFG